MSKSRRGVDQLEQPALTARYAVREAQREHGRKGRFVRPPVAVIAPGGDARGTHKHTVSLIIPTLDEADGVREILPRIPSLVTEVIVVDGGSTDGTLDVVREVLPQALILDQPGRGKGNALKIGAALAQGEIIVMMDADGSMNPEDIGLLVAALCAGADFVKGSRILPGSGSEDFTHVRRFGNAALTMAANAVSRGGYTDITFGFTGYWTTTVVELGELADGFQYEIQAAVRAARAGMRTVEVPTHEPARLGGVSKLHPIADGIAILRVILAERDRPQVACAVASAVGARPA